MSQVSMFDKSRAILRTAIEELRKTLPQPYESELEAELAGLILNNIEKYESDYLEKHKYD